MGSVILLGISDAELRYNLIYFPLERRVPDSSLRGCGKLEEQEVFGAKNDRRCLYVCV